MSVKNIRSKDTESLLATTWLFVAIFAIGMSRVSGPARMVIMTIVNE
ncbi:hypothetical protein [Endozoicomonas sp. 4G]|nr:hypothetical protein [Endozoicomonas sp. 4G]